MGLATPPPDPSLLLHPNIPKPLHQLAPRTIYGDTWWQDIRLRVKTAQNHTCAACGNQPGIDSASPYLSCHETYEVDYSISRARYIKTVALCNLCHLFIHSGFLQVMVDKGQITEERREMIMDRGVAMLREAGLIKQWKEKQRSSRSVNSGPWAGWKLILDGKEYGPSFRCYEEWYEHMHGTKPAKKKKKYEKQIHMESHWEDSDENYMYDLSLDENYMYDPSLDGFM